MTHADIPVNAQEKSLSVLSCGVARHGQAEGGVTCSRDRGSWPLGLQTRPVPANVEGTSVYTFSEAAIRVDSGHVSTT